MGKLKIYYYVWEKTFRSTMTEEMITYGLDANVVSDQVIYFFATSEEMASAITLPD